LSGEKELVHCWACGDNKVIGFKLRSVWNGRVAYDLECASCGIVGSVTKKDLESSGLKLWKIYGEHGGWQCGSLPPSRDRWWEWWSVREKEMEWRSYEDGLVLIAYSKEDSKVLQSLAQALPKMSAESHGISKWVEGMYREEFAGGPEKCHSYLKFTRLVFP